LTIEAGITASKADTSNPRRGPYNLLISSADAFRVERALLRVPQQGFTQQSSAINPIQNVIVYDGWTGTRGGKSVTYTGVSANKAYLIDSANRMFDAKSYVKQDFRLDGEDMDASRFMTQKIYDAYIGAYTNVLRSTEELTLPS
jgi:hypothetical protein